MGVTYTVDGSTVGTVRIESAETVESALTGTVGQGSFTIDDDAGTLATTGWKEVTVEEDDCSDPLTFKGFVGTRQIRRGTHKTLAGRDIVMNTKDLNEILNLRTVFLTGNRGRESVGDRVDWLLTSTHLSGLVADNGFVDYPSTMMDANDYRTSKPGDVLADCATRVNFNYFIYPDPTTGDPSLFFADSNTSTWYSSTLRISNVLSDIDWTTTFPASPEATLNIDPDSVYSRVLLSYAGGRVRRTRAATATAYIERDAVAPTSSVKRRARAVAQADQYLLVHRNEDHSIEETILVTSSKVNLVKAGMRIQVRYSHMDPEGYSSFTWWRITELRKRHVVSPGGIPEAPDEPLYEMSLRLSPQEAGCTPATIVQQKAVDNVANVDITLDANPTLGNLLIAIGMRKPSGGGNVPAQMNSGEAWTEIVQVHVDDCCGNPGSAGYAFAFYKIVDDTSPVWSRLSESGQYQWRLYELAHADPARINVLSVSNDASHVGTTFATLDLGTFSGADGVSIMCEMVGRGTDQSATAGAFGMSPWTERFDDQFDPTVGDPKPSPWFGIGDTTSDSEDLDCAWTYTESGQGNPDQSIGEWAGIALTFESECP